MCPATDFCWTCQKNNTQLNKSANLPEAKKVDRVKRQEEHLRPTSGEQEYYKRSCKDTKAHLQAHLEEADFAFGQRPCSYKGTVHYSYDYAQQLHYPSNPNQPGQINFKTPRKCGLFSVCCEAIPCQVNVPIDENVLTGKGAQFLTSITSLSTMV